MITVPRVDGQGQGQAPDQPVATQREPSDPPEIRRGRSQRLAEILAVLAQLPPDERAAAQMKLLAYPEAWRRGSWDHGDEGVKSATTPPAITEESETDGSA